jgi:Bacterial regulatory proteins, luxR family
MEAFNHHRGTQTVTEGTDAIVHLATLPPDGPTGTFQALGALLGLPNLQLPRPQRRRGQRDENLRLPKHTNAQIARRAGVTGGTVRKHLENIYARLQVSSRTAAVIGSRSRPEGCLSPAPHRNSRAGEPGFLDAAFTHA